MPRSDGCWATVIAVDSDAAAGEDSPDCRKGQSEAGKRPDETASDAYGVPIGVHGSDSDDSSSVGDVGIAVSTCATEQQ